MDLGNVSFNILFKDNPAELDAIKRRAENKLKNIYATLDIKSEDINNVKTKVEQRLKNLQASLSLDEGTINALKNKLSNLATNISVNDASIETIKRNVESKLSNIKATLLVNDDNLKKISTKIHDLTANVRVAPIAMKNPLVGSIKSVLSRETFDIKVRVKESSVSDAVRQALQRAGLRTDFSASDLRATRARIAESESLARIERERLINEQRLRTEIERTRAANIRATNAANGLANAHRGNTDATNRGVEATFRLNKNLETQVGLVGKIKTGLFGVSALYFMNGILNKVIQIGGELDNQHRAMGAILQDLGKANDLSQKISQLAIRSPFGVLDLTSFAKQLSAYTVPYNELYDTMKRLADISAGVGVDMSRIVLAYGQVKAAKFLKGTELRQFTEANIPLLDKLSDRFTKLKGEMVSAGDVLEMISKKQVSFEDVKAVLFDFTNEGGMFYNMQETLAESVKSKWKNFKDALDLMFADIAKSNNELLKKPAEMLTGMTKNWKSLSHILLSVLAGYGALRAAVVTMNAARGKEGTLALAQIKAAKAQEISNLRLAQTYRNLNWAEQMQVNSGKALSKIDIQRAIASKALTKDNLLRLVALKQINKEEAQRAVTMKLVTQAELDHAASLKKTKVLWNMFTVGVKNAALAMKDFALATLTNPMTLIIAGLSGLVYWYQAAAEKQQKLNDNIDELNTKANEGFKNLSDAVEKFSKFDGAALKVSELTTSIEDMMTKLKDYSSNWGEIFDKVFAEDNEGRYIHSLSEQYDMLARALKETAKGYELLGRSKGAIFDLEALTDGYFDEGYLTNVGDYGKKRVEFEKNILVMAVKHRLDAEAIINAGIVRNEEYRNRLSKEGNISLARKLELLYEYKGLVDDIASNNHGLGLSFSSVGQLRINEDLYNKAIREKSVLKDDRDDLVNLIIGKMRSDGDNPKDLPANKKEYWRQQVIALLNKAETDENVKKDEVDYILKAIGLTIKREGKSFDDSKTGWKRDLINTTNNSQLKNLIISAENLPKLIESLKEQKDDLQKKIAGGVPKINSQLPSAEKTLKEEYNKNKSLHEAIDTLLKNIGVRITDTSDSSSKSKDGLLERLKERYNLAKEAFSIYQKWVNLIGKEGATNKVRLNKLFSSLFADGNYDVANIKKSLEDIDKLIDNSTKERRDFKKTLSGEIEQVDSSLFNKDLKDRINEINKGFKDIERRWAVYKQLTSAGATHKGAIEFIYNKEESYESASSEMVANLQKELKKYNLDIPLDIDDKTLIEKLGGKNSELYNLFYKPIKDIQERLKKDALDIDVWQTKILTKNKTIVEKIGDIVQEYRQKGGLQLDDEGNFIGNIDSLTDKQKVLLQSLQNEVGRLRAELFKLSPLWHSIFRDKEYTSYSKIKQLSDAVNNIISSAKVNEKDEYGNAKNYIAPNPLDNTKNISLTVGDMERLRKAQEKLYHAATDKNPFKTISDGLKYLREHAGDTSEQVKMNMEIITEEIKRADKQILNMGANITRQLGGIFSSFGADGIGKGLQTFGESFSIIENFQKGGFEGIFSGVTGILSMGANIISSIFNDEKERAEFRHQMMLRDIETEKKYIQLLEEENRKRKENWEVFGGSRFGKAKEDLNTFHSSMNKIQNGLHNGKNFNSSMGRLESIKRELSAYEKLNRREFGFDIFRYKKKGKTDYTDDIARLGKEKAELEKGLASGLGDLSTGKIVTGYRRGGWLGLGKKHDTYSNLLDIYPELIDAEGRFNAEKAKSILETQRFDDATKKMLENYVSEWDKAQKALENYARSLKDLFGTIGDEMGDAIVNSFRNGTDNLSEDISKITRKYADKFIIDAAKSMTLGKVFEEFNKEIEEKSKNGNISDAEMLDMIARFGDKVAEQSEKMKYFMGELQKQEKAKGRDILLPDEKEQKGLSANIKGIQENTADLMASYLNAIRADVSVIRERWKLLSDEFVPQLNFMTKAQLVHLQNIEKNTYNNAVMATEIKDMLRSVIDGSNKIYIH